MNMVKTHYDPTTKIWSGTKYPSFFNPNQNLGILILEVLRQSPDSITQISADTNVSVTCREMYERSLKFAKFLQSIGMKMNDMVGFVTANSENLAPVVFACFSLGLPVNPMSPIMNEADIVQMYSETKPKIIFCDADNLKVVQGAVDKMESGARIFTVMEQVDGYECVTNILRKMEDENIENFEFPEIDPNSTIAILCSSGSTGFPKGICKSHKNIISGFFYMWEIKKGTNSIFFQGSPIFWLSGFYTLILGTIYKCTRVITTEAYDAQQLVDMIHKYKISVLMTPPYMLISILKLEILRPLESVQCYLVGGAAVCEQTCEKLKHFLPNGKIFTGYGCTEQDFVAINSTNKKLGSSGMVYHNVDIRIVDENGKSLGPNEHGEIYTRVPVQYNGYFNQPAKTAESLDGAWFKTGDIGYFDDEGYIYVTDRKKEMLKYKNYQVTPSELEIIINEIKGIASSCVVGVPEPSSGNDIIHAFVILEEPGALSEDFILNYVNDRVMDPKRIRGGVHFVDEFPLGLTGKVDRKMVKKMAEKMEKN